jgi:hypothetical protein
VVASLWDVGDRATADLMTAFYRELAAGRSKSEALRAAKLERIRRGSAGVGDWAAFILFGDGAGTIPLVESPPTLWPAALGLFTGLAAAAGLALRARRIRPGRSGSERKRPRPAS